MGNTENSKKGGYYLLRVPFMNEGKLLRSYSFLLSVDFFAYVFLRTTRVRVYFNSLMLSCSLKRDATGVDKADLQKYKSIKRIFIAKRKYAGVRFLNHIPS